MPNIEEMWAYVSTDDEGEGVAAVWHSGGWLPLVGADETRMQDLMPYAQTIADATGQTLMLVKFTQREDITKVQPRQ